MAAAVALALRLTIVEPYTVSSAAMTPTLQVGDRTVVVTWSALAGQIGRGDIVLVRSPDILACRDAGNSGEIALRVLGLPGETISSTDNVIYVDGRRLSEPDWYNRRFGQLHGLPIARTKIPTNHYFVLGDNRSNVCDSRSFGTLSDSSILGKVVALDYRGGHPSLHLF